MNTKIKHEDIIPDKDNPFSSCQLDREKYAKVLSSIIYNYGNGFVMAINNKWGTGKTTFVKMWQQTLSNARYTSIYFNAWENDFEDNALTAIMGELSTLIDENNEKDFKDVLSMGAILAKNILPGVIKGIASKYIDTEAVLDHIKDVSTGITAIFEKEVEVYVNRKKTIDKFKIELREFIKKTTPDKPLIFIIDELDRCRPNYSVSVLEQIKHFFSIPGIIFVLSIDKIQLGNAVRGVYGNDRIDADEYLRRFIDIEYSLPLPNSDVYIEYLYKYFNFEGFFNSTQRISYQDFRYDSDEFLETAKILLRINKITLRQQQKVFAHARLGLSSFSANGFIIPTIYVFFVYLREIFPDLYQDLKNKNITIFEFQDKFIELFKIDILNDDDKNIIATLEGYIIYYTYSFLSTSYMDRIYEDVGGERKYKVSSKVLPDSNFFESVFSRIYHRGIGVDKILNKIDLLEYANF